MAFLSYLVAYELVRGAGGPKRKIRALAPVLVLVTIYLIGYRIGGFGTFGSELYFDPMREPIAFLEVIPSHLLAFFGELFLGIPATLVSSPIHRWAVILGGGESLVLMAIILILIYRTASPAARRVVVWMGFALLGSLIPMAGALPQSRGMIVAGLGSSVLIALALREWWCELRKIPGTARWLGGVICLVLLFVHLVLNPFRWIQAPLQARAHIDSWVEKQLANPWEPQEEPPQRLIFLTADLKDGMGRYFARKFLDLPVPASYWILSTANSRHRYHRPAVDTLVLELIDRDRNNHSLIPGTGNPRNPFETGDQVGMTGMDVTILQTDSSGPVRIQFKFDRSLDDSSLQFMVLQDGIPVSVRIPPVGKSIDLIGPVIQTL